MLVYLRALFLASNIVVSKQANVFDRTFPSPPTVLCHQCPLGESVKQLFQSLQIAQHTFKIFITEA